MTSCDTSEEGKSFTVTCKGKIDNNIVNLYQKKGPGSFNRNEKQLAVMPTFTKANNISFAKQIRSCAFLLASHFFLDVVPYCQVILFQVQVISFTGNRIKLKNVYLAQQILSGDPSWILPPCTYLTVCNLPFSGRCSGYKVRQGVGRPIKVDVPCHKIPSQVVL